MSDFEEGAKAVQKVSELGIKGLETGDKFGGFIAQILGEPFKEASGILTDRIKFYRVKKFIEMQGQVNSILESKNVTSPRPVPPKLALPILEGATLEDDPDLQNMWSRLLANAMDPNFSGDLRNGFVEMIKGMTGKDALILSFFYRTLQREGRVEPVENVTQYHLTKEKIIQGLNISEVDYQVSAFNLMRVQCLAPAVLKATGIMFGGEATTIYKGTDAVTLTPLGIKFAQACME